MTLGSTDCKRSYTPVYSQISTNRLMNDSYTVFGKRRNLKKTAGITKGIRSISKQSMGTQTQGRNAGRAAKIIRWISNIISPIAREGKNERLEGSTKDSLEDIDIPHLADNRTKKRAISNNRNEFSYSNKSRRTDSSDISFSDLGPKRVLQKPLTFSKHPFGWNEWKTTRPTDDNNKDTRSATHYGTSFQRSLKKRHIPNNQGFMGLTEPETVKELEYLRKIYNGEYEMPETVRAERERQLELLEEDRRNDKHLKDSIWNLSQRISSVLRDNFPSSAENDLSILGVKKIDPLEKKKKDFERQKLKFDRSKILFEEEHKNYKKLQEERRRIQTEARQKDQKKTLVPKLSGDAVNEVQKVLRRNDNGLLMNRDNLEIHVRDFKTLGKTRWLNDTIIEFFMKTIEKRQDSTVAFNSFFYTTLSERGYQGVRRWMKRKKKQISKLDKIFVPVNLNQSHWALGLIDIKNKRIIFTDSLSNGPNAMSFAILTDLKNYVIEESQKELGEDFELVHLQCPQQPNGYDCGIYVCMNTLYLSNDQNADYEYEEAVQMRTYIGHMILSDVLK
ncbi:Ubiquitin-like-specific protease 1 [Nakaseomyces bracarensis]|uniref:Ubiquitin-like-specific protease 1 n=1 Tax=Nakaseomyces bracarensis TaxID=273131 RepID=A0ABR4NXR1_9SACH